MFRALQNAARARQSEQVLLFALAWRESRFNPDAQNSASTAQGLMQFTRATWLEVIRDHGEAVGLYSYAAALVTDHSTGDITTRDRRILSEILAMRNDPQLSAKLAMARLEAERLTLARTVGRRVADADMYLVHFLGPVGARRFLRELARAPSQRASDVVGADAVAANRNVFLTREGRHLSLRGVYASIQSDLRQQQAVYASLVERMNAPAAMVELASAR